MLEVAVPPGVVTEIIPVLVPEPTVAVMCTALSTVKLDAAVPLNETAVVPVKFVPLIATEVPAFPETGVKLVIVATGVVCFGAEEELLAPHAIKEAANPMQAMSPAFRQTKTAIFSREAGCPIPRPETLRAHHATKSMHYISIRARKQQGC